MDRLITSLFLVLSLAAAGCGAAEIGEDCETAGSTDDCVDGAVCTNEEGDINRCRAICDAEEDCDLGEGCNGVSGTSIKSCQPD
jgi:hypothetical protein